LSIGIPHTFTVVHGTAVCGRVLDHPPGCRASDSLSNATTVRITHQFQPAQPANRPAAERTATSLVAQVQIRHSRSEHVNVFPDLGGTSRTTTVAIPVTINVQRRRHLHAVRLDVSTSLSRAESRYAHVEDVAGGAGIVGPAREPFAWGVPSLSFSTYSSARDVNPTRRHDQRLVTGYTWTHTAGRHTVASGAEGRFDWSDNQTDPNARGTFVFTGRHTAGTSRVPRGAGFDFADFLLGLPQQASVQYGPGRVHIRGRALSLYVQDDWRRSSALTLTLGLRYERVWPFVEANRQMVNLDVAPDFTEVVPVLSGGAGPFTGIFPTALMHADPNKLPARNVRGALTRGRPAALPTKQCTRLPAAMERFVARGLLLRWASPSRDRHQDAQRPCPALAIPPHAIRPDRPAARARHRVQSGSALRVGEPGVSRLDRPPGPGRPRPRP
jgi:TonB dependent receptor